MRTRRLGHTDLMVTEICLGTMTWGSSQNNEADAHAQMDYAFDAGVTFWDTAELYPVNPTEAATYTLTEQYIGNWLKKTGKRSEITLASKVAGPGRPHIRNGMGFTKKSIGEALDGSLKRLNTDYLDLYQLHWPNRGSYHFGQSWNYAPSSAPTAQIVDDMLETLEAVGDAVKAGKVRHFGLSNETAWGTMEYLKLAETHDLPKAVSIQNEYSLMYQLHNLDLAEVSAREGVSLLPYSALAAGWLTGKYYNGARPAGTRFVHESYAASQRLTKNAQKCADAYVDVARKYDLDPAQMAIAWTLTKPFVASTIIGATSVEQLKADIAAADVKLSDAVLNELEAVRRDFPMPY